MPGTLSHRVAILFLVKLKLAMEKREIIFKVRNFLILELATDQKFFILSKYYYQFIILGEHGALVFTL